ncbi:complex I NDUFA9 subunit family protein [Novosphingobium mangrovi (ex Huang et al. 2023)]|uniref:Complex I NDUFA9 subunit family protein n=1 Tax=Novosphingobium mangrovi (ex Huang et al. 2023) TaxID=2976432 RepID=A0ABT2I6A9_9SPHN|nr:complex I NDUFA9 subunit family protein [Novosphingobium mangrovi (ex Huang et al. 2023)]MCT2400352.1 complex I NDUFA9 subunit family protein [Novosphingobium mangrovi (ex Huang et al. 2023)]
MSQRPIDSLAGKIVTVLGGSGFVGRHLAQELLARGARLRIASRNPRKAYAIKPLGNLGQVQFARVDVTRPDSLAAVLAGSDAVVNLVGAFAGDLDALQGNGAGGIAAAAKAAGAKAFVHVSALGADAGSDVDYARTKAEGEQAVRSAFPDATIVRPSLMFGPDDKFVMMFGGLITRMPGMPVFAPEAKLQPVFVDDVAEAIANALADPAAHGGKIYDLAGPEVVTMLELNERIAAAEGRSRSFAALPDAVAGLIATLTGWLPGAPITSDQFKLLKAGSVASGTVPGIADLGVSPRPLGLFLDRWMVQFRKHGRFGVKNAAA